MKLHCVTWKNAGVPKKFFAASGDAASKKKTELKKHGAQEIDRKVVEIDTRRAGLIAWLNKEFGGEC